MGLRVKICGIRQPEQGTAIAGLGATALGFICAPESARYVSPQQMRAVVDQLIADHRTCDRIGVFVNPTLAVIQATVAIAGLTGVQLHGSEPPEFCAQVRQALPQVELIKALRVKSPETLIQANDYVSQVHTLLLDAYHPAIAGGTGQTLDWQGLNTFTPGCPWFLAGGLTPDNILSALEQVHPSGIDLSSGVEHCPGDKDLTAVARLFDQLRGGGYL